AHISSVIAMPLIALGNHVNWLMVHSVDVFARVGIASLRLPRYTGWPASVYVLYYLPLGLLVVMLANWNPLARQLSSRSKHRIRFTTLAVALQLVLLLMIMTHPLSARRPDGRLRIDFLDVGQGDSALVTMPDGTTLLIDGGGRPSFRGRKSEPSNE